MSLEVSIITPVRATKPHHLDWLNEMIYSVANQTAIKSCEMIVVDDHSTIDLAPVKDQWDRIRWVVAEGKGVSAARNQAASMARAPLILPGDADDKFAPYAVESFLRTWNEGGKESGAGIVYSDIIMFGTDYQQMYLAPPQYSFHELLERNFMLVCCLHRKSDWQRCGGWRSDMEGGLEDWEYWITLGEMGVCGYHVGEPLYWYRRNPGGRLAKLKSNVTLWQQSKMRMRDLHLDTYNGRYPMGCCGGGKPGRAPTTAGRMATLQALQNLDDRVAIQYTGRREGGFNVKGIQSGIVYHISGKNAFVEDQNGKLGVHKMDVELFLSFHQGLDFKRVEEPKKPKPVAQAKPRPQRQIDPNIAVDSKPKVGSVKPKSSPEPVEPVAKEVDPFSEMDIPTSVPDVLSLSLTSLKMKDLTPPTAYVMLSIEQARTDRPPRKTVVKYLEKIAHTNIGE